MAVRRLELFAAIIFVFTFGCAPAWSQCRPEWTPGFGGRGFSYTFNLSDAEVYDDGRGSGPTLYACGSFRAVDNAVTNYIARWNGERWIPVGNGMNGPVYALAVFHDGSGPALFAGGLFTEAGGIAATNIAKWNGTKWSVVGEGPNDAIFELRTVTNRGVSELYAGGKFTQVGGISANRIARWNGDQWFALGDGIGGPYDYEPYVRVIFDVLDDDDELTVYVGGDFVQCGSLTVNHVARWDGTAWNALGTGIHNGSFGHVYAFEYFDDGNGPALFVGGNFGQAGSVQTANIARWDGSAWSGLNGGVSMDSWGSSGWVGGIGIYDDGNKKRLHVSGNFYDAGGVFVDNNAIWDGQAWSRGGSMVCGTRMLTVEGVPGLPSPGLISVGYIFHNYERFRYLAGVALWDGSEWQPMEGQIGNGLDSSVLALGTYSGPDGTRLYAGGSFARAGGIDLYGLAVWDGEQWHASDVDSSVRRFVTARIGNDTTEALYVMGVSIAIGERAESIAKWDGTQWSHLAGGTQYVPYAAVQWDPDGDGPRDSVLVFGGNFDQAGELEVRQIAVWDGVSWSTLDTGFEDSYSPVVRALAVFDPDGPGPKKEFLYAAGRFDKASSHNVHNIARWDGAEWRNVSDGLDGDDPNVYALAVFDDGTGPALYAGGKFTTAGGINVSNIARWDGRDWSDVGLGVNGIVSSLYVFDDSSGFGPELFVGGAFTQAGALPARYLARWNGSLWSSLGLGLNGSVTTMAAFDEDDEGPGRPALYLGGSFSVAGKHASGYIARWGYPNRSSCVADVAGLMSCGDGLVNAHDLKFVIDRWGQHQSPAEINGDDEVGLPDLEAVINAWGPCP